MKIPFLGIKPGYNELREEIELQRHLVEAGIGTLIHYPVPPHLSGAYSDLGQRQGTYPHRRGTVSDGIKLADWTAFERRSAKSCNRGNPFFPLKP